MEVHRSGQLWTAVNEQPRNRENREKSPRKSEHATVLDQKKQRSTQSLYLEVRLIWSLYTRFDDYDHLSLYSSAFDRC